MPAYLQFASQDDFRRWLEENCQTSDGVWLLFGKAKGPKTLKASEALAEALCFGWIDGQMQSLDETAYIKYFAPRRSNSKWSEKNKALVQRLEEQGLMTDYGRTKIAEAKHNGQWQKPPAPAITDAEVEALAEILREYEAAYSNFQAMSPSVQRTYTKAYLDAKTEAGRASRIAWMVERLAQNLKPM